MILKIKNNISLVSLHIPKTAGTSFRSILKNEFGRRTVARFDIYPSGKIKLDEKSFEKTELHKKIQVIHGHYTYQSITNTLDLSPSVSFITWLRDPVERVISNYFFLRKIVAERLNETPEENLMNRIGKTLEEFVVMEENQNVMSKFLNGANLSSFKFVGFQHDFETEIKRLEQIMQWKKIKNVEYNVTGNVPKISESATLDLIKKCNAEDVSLYNSALSQRTNSIHLHS